MDFFQRWGLDRILGGPGRMGSELLRRQGRTGARVASLPSQMLGFFAALRMTAKDDGNGNNNGNDNCNGNDNGNCNDNGNNKADPPPAAKDDNFKIQKQMLKGYSLLAKRWDFFRVAGLEVFPAGID